MNFEKSALMEIGNIITTYAMSAIDEGGTGSVQFQSDLYVHEYNETDYNIITSVILRSRQTAARWRFCTADEIRMKIRTKTA